MNLKKLIVFVLLAVASPATHAGVEVGNGGNADAQEIYNILNDVVTNVEQTKDIFPEVNVVSLRAKLQSIKIIILPSTFLNGVETHALNDGKDTISINGSKWPLIENYNKTQAILLHEILGLMGIEINNYHISSRILHQNRFSKPSMFECNFVHETGEELSGSCNMSLSYKLSAKAFVVTNANCGFQSGYDYFFDIGTDTYFNESICQQSPRKCGIVSKPDTRHGRMQVLKFSNMNEIFFRDSERVRLICKKAGQHRNRQDVMEIK